MHDSDERRAGRAMIWNVVQKGLSMGLYLLGTLVLGRLLTPQDFGMVAIAAVVVTTAMGATETGMSTAMVQSAERDRVHYDLAWSISMIRGVLVCAVLMIGAPLIARLFNSADSVPFIRLMALVPFISSLASPRLADLIRGLNFSRLAIIYLSAVVVELGVAISLAGSLGGRAIILGKIAGVVTLAGTSFIVAPYAPRLRLHHEAGRQLIAFGRWVFAIAILGVASDLFLRALISTRLGVAALGLFSLADKLGQTPYYIANEAVGGVALPLYARLRSDPPRLTAALRSHLVALMYFLLPATALLIALVAPVEQRILGPAWAGTSPMVIVLAIGYLFELIFMAVAPLLTATSAMPRLFLVDLLQYLALIGAAVFLAGPLGLMAIGIARILASLVVVVAGVWVAPPIFAPIAGQLIRSGVFLSLLAAIAAVVTRLVVMAIPGVPGVIVGGAVGGAMFLAVSWFADAPLGTGIRDSLAAFFPVLAVRPASA